MNHSITVCFKKNGITTIINTLITDVLTFFGGLVVCSLRRTNPRKWQLPKSPKAADFRFTVVRWRSGVVCDVSTWTVVVDEGYPRLRLTRAPQVAIVTVIPLVVRYGRRFSRTVVHRRNVTWVPSIVHVKYFWGVKSAFFQTTVGELVYLAGIQNSHL